MTYDNGRLPDTALATIPGGGRLLKPVAADWVALCDEVERLFGWRPQPTGVHDSYRPYSVQESTFLARYTTTRLAGRPTKVWGGVTYWLRAGQATAAVPGTSNHGWACAVDVTGLGGFAGVRHLQFATVAARFGWTNTEGRSINEPWHWVDVGTANLVPKGLLDFGTVPDAPSVAAPAAVKPTNPLKGKRMLIYAGGGIWLLDGGRMLPIGDPKSADALAASGVPSVTISRADADRWIAAGSPGLLMVRGPGTRGVALLGGKDGWSSMTSEADVTALQAKGVPIATVSDGQFVAFMN